VIQKLGGKGNVVFFTFAHQANTEERLKGFKEVFATRPDIHIVDVVDIKGDTRKAFDWTQEAMASDRRQEGGCLCQPGIGLGKAVADALKRASATDRWWWPGTWIPIRWMRSRPGPSIRRLRRSPSPWPTSD
jgi:ribose transport system substrate-binding protein